MVAERNATQKPTRKKRVVRNYSRKLALRKFFLGMSSVEREDFCRRAKTTVSYINQIYGGWRLGSPFVAQRIEDASGGRIPAWYLRPDIYQKPSDAPVMR